MSFSWKSVAYLTVIGFGLSTLQSFGATSDTSNPILANPASKTKATITSMPVANSKMPVFHASKLRPIVVLTTSLDERCTVCIARNEAMLRAQHALGDQFEFVQLIHDGWNPEVKAEQFPFAHIHYEGSSIVTLGADLDDNLLTVIPSEFALRKAVIDRPLSDTPIPTVTAQELPDYVAAHSEGKPFVLHVSSLDPNCPSCVMSNKFIRDSVREVGDYYSYAEVLYSPFLAATNDEEMKAFLKQHGTSIVALPAFFIFKDNTLNGAKYGLWETSTKDLQNFKEQQQK